MQHIIKKQIMELDLDKKLDPFSMQHKMSECYWKEILPLLEKAFDELTDEDEIIQLDKMEIDLGVLRSKAIEQNKLTHDLNARIVSQIKEAIRRVKSQRNFVQNTRSINIARQWLFYLQNGYLKWNTLAIDDTWYTAVLEALAGDFTSITELRRTIETNSNALKRIVADHPPEFLIKLIEVLTAEKQANLSEAAEELFVVFDLYHKQTNRFFVQNAGDLKQKIWQLIVKAAATGRKNSAPTQLAEKIIHSHISGNAEIQTLFNSLSGRLTVLLPVFQKLIVIVSPGQLPTHNKTDNDINSQLPLPVNDREKDTAEEDALMIDDLLKPPGEILLQQEDISELKNAEVVDEEGIYVAHAGLVLLHPFLGTLFTRLGLVKEKNFSDLYAQQKALYLLNYMATGNVTAKEYELVIPKILCNYSLQKPVAKIDDITQEELDETDQLLIAAIEKWDKLKNSSIAALREGFLQRRGKVFTKKDAIHIQVEANGIDVLLDYLPWGISIIKLPWMKEMMQVEWR